TRFKQRTLVSRWPTCCTRSAVPSGESSSTNRISQPTPGKAATNRSTKGSILSTSLNVGATIDSSQAIGAFLSICPHIARIVRQQSISSPHTPTNAPCIAPAPAAFLLCSFGLPRAAYPPLQPLKSAKGSNIVAPSIRLHISPGLIRESREFP